MFLKKHTSDAEAERAVPKEAGWKARFLNLKTFKLVLSILVFGLRLWRIITKVFDWMP